MTTSGLLALAILIGGWSSLRHLAWWRVTPLSSGWRYRQARREERSGTFDGVCWNWDRMREEGRARRGE